MLHTIVLSTLIVNLVGDINISDHRQQLLAADCLMHIFNDGVNDSQIIMITEADTATPGYEVENYLLQILNKGMRWTLQIINRIDVYRFGLLKVCTNCNFIPMNINNSDKETRKLYKHQFQSVMPTGFYIFIADDIAKLRNNIWKLKKIEAYRMRAMFIIYYYKKTKDEIKTATELLQVLYNASNYKSLVMLPSTNQSFNYYTIDLYSKRAVYCMKQPEYIKINECINGHLIKPLNKHKRVKNLNCSIDAFAMIIPPFIINENMGLEIYIMKELENRMNISFVYQITKVANHWGTYVNGTWTGLSNQIYKNRFSVGVGCVSQDENRLRDFDFSSDYTNDKLVWIVPSAKPISQWKVIIVIFSNSLWFLLLVIQLIFWILFYISANINPLESNYLRSIGGSMTMSLQITIQTATQNQPNSRTVRGIFISYVMFNIVIGCSYQSGLIDALTITRYETQISDEEDVLNSGLHIGGLKAYKNIFNVSEDSHAMHIYNMYKINTHGNDSMQMWLESVGVDRSTITVLGEFYVKYHIARKESFVTNHDMSPKVYIVPDVLFTEPIRLILAKGFPLREAFNQIIQDLLRAGLVAKWTNHYLKYMEKRHIAQNGEHDNDSLEETMEHKTNGVTKLTPMHMQGAFLLLCLGHSAGTLFFICEIVQHKLKYRVSYREIKEKVNTKKKSNKFRKTKVNNTIRPLVL